MKIMGWKNPHKKSAFTGRLRVYQWSLACQRYISPFFTSGGPRRIDPEGPQFRITRTKPELRPKVAASVAKAIRFAIMAIRIPIESFNSFWI
jgi:hypothetical protein